MSPSVALSMIVRDASVLLPSCLESAHNCVQEIVLADTGSLDNTIDIASRFGARVISIGWDNDFAAARNRSLQEVKSDWVLMLDADEQLDSAAVTAIPSLITNSSAAGYLVSRFGGVFIGGS